MLFPQFNEMSWVYSSMKSLILIILSSLLLFSFKFLPVLDSFADVKSFFLGSQ